MIRLDRREMVDIFTGVTEIYHLFYIRSINVLLLQRHGCLVVRGFFESVRHFIKLIDQDFIEVVHRYVEVIVISKEVQDLRDLGLLQDEKVL